MTRSPLPVESAAGDEAEQVACRWLKANRAIWEAWLPDDTATGRNVCCLSLTRSLQAFPGEEIEATVGSDSDV